MPSLLLAALFPQSQNGVTPYGSSGTWDRFQQAIPRAGLPSAEIKIHGTSLSSQENSSSPGSSARSRLTIFPHGMLSLVHKRS